LQYSKNTNDTKFITENTSTNIKAVGLFRLLCHLSETKYFRCSGSSSTWTRRRVSLCHL